MEKYVPKCIDFVLEGVTDDTITTPLQQTIPFTNLNMATQLCTLLEVMLGDGKQVGTPQGLEATFIFCVVGSIGASIVQCPSCKDRDRFDKFLKVNVFAKILVPTVDTVRSTWLLNTLLQAGKAVLFVGESGTAKTVVIQKYFSTLPAQNWLILSMNFSSRTTSMDVQITIEDSVEKRTKDTYGPPVGRKMIVYVDDLNMPKVDTYGTQQPIAMLKLFVERSGIYDRGKDLNWKNIKDGQFVGAMGRPGGARNPVDPRFISLFSVFEIQFPADSSLAHIYNSILDAHARILSPQIQSFVKTITEMTLGLYAFIVEKLPPTPSRFHYIFNLRDLSRIFEGLTLSTPDKFKTVPEIVRLWRNECLRIFFDRLINEKDKEIVTTKLEEIVTERLQEMPGATEQILKNLILFADYRHCLHETVPRLYEDLGNFDFIKPHIENVLDDYNITNKKMNLVMFEDALEHLTRIHRLMPLPQGNALLVGVGGSGKKSLSKLGAFAAGCRIFEIVLTRGYNEEAFREDLRILCGILGVENKAVVFLFTDAHVVEEGFLELINNMLTSGMVLALFKEEEKDAMITQVRDAVVASGVLDTKENCWQYFINRCPSNLHITLAMSPVGDTLRTRCRNFPGMVSSFPKLPSVVHLQKNSVISRRRCDHVCWSHGSLISLHPECGIRRANSAHQVRHAQELLGLHRYRTSLTKRRALNLAQCKRLDGGLSKIAQAKVEVAQMQLTHQSIHVITFSFLLVTVAEAKIVVDAKTSECNALLEVISKNTEVVVAKQNIAQEKQKSLSTESEIIQRQKVEAEVALAEALPALEAAAEALNNLKKEEITEIRSFAKPNVYVQKVCECVVILRGFKDVPWRGAKQMMADNRFLQTLLEFDKDSITEKQMRPLREYFRDPNMTVAMC
ncbi:hypothetical protein R1flu_026880 [Riccia fluitans]|uniref:Dynein heavy chain n=1 Tax=Riccia fluitans TaxID=41844 RepID=A0ABD1XH71_9MARC